MFEFSFHVAVFEKPASHTHETWWKDFRRIVGCAWFGCVLLIFSHNSSSFDERISLQMFE